MSSLSKRWPNCTVYYTINSALPEQFRVTDAISHWESQYSISFVLRTSQANYIEFVSSSSGGCSSRLGMIGGRQEIKLGSYCSTGNAIHEIGHALGFLHEHQRTDRDSSIIIHNGNIRTNAVNNFKSYTELNIPGYQIGNFDFGSIMLYGSSAFSSNGLPTITKVDGSTFYAQRSSLSDGDLDMIENMYGCNVPIWSNSFTNGWNTTNHVRTIADVNGDGKADIIGFGSNNVLVSLSNGSGFGTPQNWSNSFINGWDTTNNVRTVADVNGDGKADIIGFGDYIGFVSLSDGNSFDTPQDLSNSFTSGWNTSSHVRTVADVNGDGKADIIGFGNNGVFVLITIL